MNPTPESPSRDPSAEERSRLRVKLARLEADLTYFQARLEILGEPRTSNQHAQRKAFKILQGVLAKRVARVQRRLLGDA